MKIASLVLDYDTQVATTDSGGTLTFDNTPQHEAHHRISWKQLMECLFAAEQIDPAVPRRGSWWKIDMRRLRRAPKVNGKQGSVTFTRVDGDPVPDGMRLRLIIEDYNDLDFPMSTLAEHDDIHVAFKHDGFGEFFDTACPLSSFLLSLDDGQDKERWFRTTPWFVRFESQGRGHWTAIAKTPVVERPLPLEKKSFTRPSK